MCQNGTFTLKKINKRKKKFLEDALKHPHAIRFAFEKRVSFYLLGKISENDVSTVVSASRALRFCTSAGKRSSKSGSQSSSAWKAKLAAKEELAKLKLKLLEQKQRLEREMQEEMNKQLEIMKQKRKKKAEEKRFSLEFLQACQSLRKYLSSVKL